MNEGVKSISLDDIGESPKPIGLATTADKVLFNKTLQYTPQYSSTPGADFKNFAAGTLRGTPEGTKPRGAEKFTLTNAIGRISNVFPANFSQPKQKTSVAVVAGVVALAAVFYLLYFDPQEQLAGGVQTGAAGEKAAPAAKVSTAEKGATPKADVALKPKLSKIQTPSKPKPEVAETLPPVKPQTTQMQNTLGNPYWKLPNPVANATDAPTPLTVQQTEAWRGGLAHPFNFQRYKVTEDMRQAKVYGSVSILYEAIAQPKFWTRMEALLGISEQGVAIDTESMRAAIGDARSDLVHNYFRRFRNNFGIGTEHVMRQALRVVDSKTRRLILTELATRRSEANDIYLIAATLDPDLEVKAFATGILDKRPASATARQSYDSAVSVAAVAVPKSNTQRSVPIDIQVERIPANLNVEEVYFITDNDLSTVEVPIKTEAPERKGKSDNGFNGSNPTQSIPIETEKMR